MKNGNTRLRLFVPWQFDNEVYDLNKASDEGWQLTRFGFLHSEYEYDPSIRWRYALDYQFPAPQQRYLEAFRDGGWELVTDAGGIGRWFCFRKPYDPALPEDEYAIYTDKRSFRRMRLMWLFFGSGCAAAAVLRVAASAALQSFISLPELITTLWLAFFAVMQSVLLARAGTGQTRRFSFGWEWLDIPLIAVLAANAVQLISQGIAGGWFFLVLDAVFLLAHLPLYAGITFRRAWPRRLLRGALPGIILLPVLALLACFISISIQMHKAFNDGIVPVTAENDPTRVFLALTPDTGMEEAFALARSYNCAAQDGMEEHPANPDKLDKQIIHITPYGGDWAYTWVSPDANVTALELDYSMDSEPYLICAKLSIHTDDGSAVCWWYPTSYTEWGHGSGYNLSVRSSGSLLDRHYYPADAQEAVDIAWQVVYPNGLS